MLVDEIAFNFNSLDHHYVGSRWVSHILILRVSVQQTTQRCPLKLWSWNRRGRLWGRRRTRWGPPQGTGCCHVDWRRTTWWSCGRGRRLGSCRGRGIWRRRGIHGSRGWIAGGRCGKWRSGGWHRDEKRRRWRLRRRMRKGWRSRGMNGWMWGGWWRGGGPHKRWSSSQWPQIMVSLLASDASSLSLSPFHNVMWVSLSISVELFSLSLSSLWLPF